LIRVLVTGFEPFNGSAVNPSQRLVETLEAAPPDGVELASAVLPVAYARAASALRDAIEGAQPDIVICFGQADGRTGSPSNASHTTSIRPTRLTTTARPQVQRSTRGARPRIARRCRSPRSSAELRGADILRGSRATPEDFCATTSSTCSCKRSSGNGPARAAASSMCRCCPSRRSTRAPPACRLRHSCMPHGSSCERPSADDERAAHRVALRACGSRSGTCRERQN